MKHEYHTNGTEPPQELQQDGSPAWVFVFGSNLAGRHGAGAARCAYEYYGARMGVGYGREGRSFAIPTKDEYLNTLPVTQGQRSIVGYINLFLTYANHRFTNAHEKFWVTGIGTGLAGYDHSEIAPHFKHAPLGMFSFPIEWMEYLEEKADVVEYHNKKIMAQISNSSEARL